VDFDGVNGDDQWRPASAINEEFNYSNSKNLQILFVPQDYHKAKKPGRKIVSA